MINFSAIFSEFKRLLAISSTSRQDHDTTPPIISPSSSEPTSNLRYPNTYRNGIPFPPPPRYTPAYGPHSLYPGLHITSHYAMGHLGSVTDSHPPPASPTRSRAPTSWSPSSTLLQVQDYSLSRSDNSINMPPPAYFSGDRPPTYSHNENSIGPTWHTARVQSGGLFDMASLRRSRISPVVGPVWSHRVPSDPSQNRYPGSYLSGPATPRRGMHRGTLFARIIPTRRNIWLPAIVVGAVIGVYVLVKVGGKDEETKK